MARGRILHEIRLDKIAAVDRPCQEPATAVILKRAGAPGTETDQGDSSMSDVLKKMLGLPATATDAEVNAAIEKRAADDASTQERLAKAEAENVRLAKVAALPADQRAHYDDLAKADKSKADAFLAMDDEGKKDECKKAASGDEFLVVDGQRISKREVGDSAFTFMKAQADRLAKAEDDIKKSKEEATNARIAKRVGDEFAHLAGTPEDRALVLKMLEGADEATRTAGEALLKAAEAASKFAFEKAGRGHGPADETSPQAQLAKKAAEIRKAEPALSEAQAMDKAMQQNPALYDATVVG